MSKSIEIPLEKTRIWTGYGKYINVVGCLFDTDERSVTLRPMTKRGFSDSISVSFSNKDALEISKEMCPEFWQDVNTFTVVTMRMIGTDIKSLNARQVYEQSLELTTKFHDPFKIWASDEERECAVEVFLKNYIKSI